MNREDIIRMAQEAGWEMDNSCVLSPQVLWYIYQEQLEKFAALVASAEREECAKLARQFGGDWAEDAIRARGQE
jgi:hypothetical protein